MNEEFTKEEIDKIESAFKLDATPKEVALEVGLNYIRILDWLAIGDNAQRVEELRLRPRWEAKKIVTTEAMADVKTAQWYLDRKANDEFSVRKELTGKDGKDLIPKPLLYNVRGDNSTSEGDEVKEEN